MRQQEDWYAYLKLSADTPTEQVEQAVERLSRQAAALAVTAPERSQRLRDTVRAIKRDLLSGPESRARYDAGLAAATEAAGGPAAGGPAAAGPVAAGPAAGAAPVPQLPPPYAGPQPPVAGPPPLAPQPAWGPPSSFGPLPSAGPLPPGGAERIGSRIVRFLRTGWTCSSCGKEALPSDKFCTRCGTTITPTRRDGVASPARPGCANCAAPLGANDGFCSRCGTPAENKR